MECYRSKVEDLLVIYSLFLHIKKMLLRQIQRRVHSWLYFLVQDSIFFFFGQVQDSIWRSLRYLQNPACFLGSLTNAKPVSIYLISNFYSFSLFLSKSWKHAIQTFWLHYPERKKTKFVFFFQNLLFLLKTLQPWCQTRDF